MRNGFSIFVVASVLGAWVAPVLAQDDIPLLRPEEIAVLRKQDAQFNRTIQPVLGEGAKSTVRVWHKDRLEVGDYLAYGTVVGDGTQVLSKWSELRDARPDTLLIQSGEGAAFAAQIVRVYPKQDLALLSFEGEALEPVTWSQNKPPLGSFMAATQPDGELAGFGVMSVRERSLRDSDQAFLGVVGDLSFSGPGVKVRQVSKETGAAEAGIVPGDIILEVGPRKISGLMELRNALLPFSPGDNLVLSVKREEGIEKVEVLLGSRPEFPNYLGARLYQMERMGTKVSRVRDSFTNVIQTDMGLKPNQVGGPVVNLKGEVIGITLARADRTRSFVMSAPGIAKLLEKEGQDPLLAMAEVERQRQEQLARRQQPQMPQARKQASPEQLERHLKQMRRLMRLMEDEMDALER